MKPSRLLTGTELQGLSLPPSRFYLEPYIPQEGVVFLFGKSGAYKTLLCSHIAKGIADPGCNELWGLRITHAQPVLFVQVDSPEIAYIPRAQKVGFGGMEVDFMLCYPSLNMVEPSTRRDVEVVEQLRVAHTARQYKVVFVDVLRSVHHLDDKLSENVHPVYSAFNKLFPGAVIVVLHHEKKSIKDETEEMQRESHSGSNAWQNHATVAVKVQVIDRKKHIIKVTQTKSQVAPEPPPLLLKVSPSDLIYTAHAAAVGEVMPILAEAAKQGLGKRETDLLVAETLGIAERTARSRRLLIEAGEELPGSSGIPD